MEPGHRKTTISHEKQLINQQHDRFQELYNNTHAITSAQDEYDPIARSRRDIVVPLVLSASFSGPEQVISTRVRITTLSRAILPQLNLTLRH